MRPYGGRLADRFGGARVTFWNFLLMAAGAAVVLTASLVGSLPLFIAGFLTLFVLSGVGNGSTYKMIPAIFASESRTRVARGADRERSEADSRRLAAGLIGIAGAIGALGGVLVNLAFRQSFLTHGHRRRRLHRLHRLLRRLPGGDLGGLPAPAPRAAARSLTGGWSKAPSRPGAGSDGPSIPAGAARP